MHHQVGLRIFTVFLFWQIFQRVPRCHLVQALIKVLFIKELNERNFPT